MVYLLYIHDVIAYTYMYMYMYIYRYIHISSLCEKTQKKSFSKFIPKINDGTKNVTLNMQASLNCTKYVTSFFITTNDGTKNVTLNVQVSPTALFN